MLSRTHRNMLAAWAIGLCAVALPTTLSAQATGDASTTQTTNTNDDDGRDWGWIGLIGLAGLLGMRRREPEVRTDRVHDRTADRSTTGSTSGRL